MEVYLMMLAFCNEVAVTWRKTQRVNLAWTMYGLWQRKSLTLSHLAQCFPLPLQPKTEEPRHSLWHRLKRLRRFLSNPRVPASDLMRRFSYLAASLSDEAGQRLSLLVDLTYFEPYAYLAISVPKGGRALPIAWHAFRRDLAGEATLSQNQLVEQLLAQAFGYFAPAIETVLVADREFRAARASQTHLQKAKRLLHNFPRCSRLHLSPT